MTCSQADGGCPFIAGAESVFQLHMKIESIWQHTQQADIKNAVYKLQPKCYMYSPK
jgi:hypothetical protein